MLDDPASEGKGVEYQSEEQEMSSTLQRGSRHFEALGLYQPRQDSQGNWDEKWDESPVDSQQNTSLPTRDPSVEFYEKYGMAADKYDEDFVKKCYEELNTAMFFGCLLSAVTSAFIMIDNTVLGNDDNPTLPQWESPPRAFYRMLLASLVSSLLATFLAILAREWAEGHILVVVRGSAIKRNGIVTWYFVCLIQSLEPMLWGALFLLSCSLFLCPWIDTTTASVVFGVTSLCATFYVVETPSYHVTLHYAAGWLRRQWIWIELKHAVRFDKPRGRSVNKRSDEVHAALHMCCNRDSLERSPHKEDLDSGYMSADAGERSRNPVNGEDVVALCPALRTMPEAPTPAWIRLIDQPLPTAERVSLIAEIFSDHIQADAVKLLRGGDAQTFVDVIDETLDALPPWLHKRCLIALYKTCGRSGLLPTSIKVQVPYDRADVPLYHGGHADIWKGQYRGYTVRVKQLKLHSSGNFEEITKRFCKEVVIWKSLRHPNVLPILGAMTGDHHLAMVSEWMTGGNINEFVRANRNVNRFELLKDVARGLMYMHSQEVIHGDLKGANTLIDKSGRACIADFGILTILSDRSLNPHSSSAIDGTVRWMSPELLHPEHFDFKDSRPTKASDCYALGMVVWEVLSGRAPYSELTQVVIIWSVIKGKRPERPEGQWFTDDLWRTLEQCWSPQPKERPETEVVFDCLGRAATEWSLPPGLENGSTSVPTDVFRTTSHP